ALGVMSLFWTAVVGAAIFAEKVLPRGERLAAAVAVALVVLGLAVALAGGDVPGFGNCRWVCPWRRLGRGMGRPLTHGVCQGALSWRIVEGRADGVPLD